MLIAVACTAGMPFAGESGSADRAPIEQLVEPNPDIDSRDLYYGVGGRKGVPRTDGYRFLKRDESGASTNLEVEDASGRRWDAKLGVEAKSEVAASRLLWAIGFHQPPVYHVSKWRIESGEEEVGEQPEARFRLEQPNWKKDGKWEWQDNPFVGTRELRGLVVMMALLNSWDLKTSNNQIYEVKGSRPDRLYVAKDLGESFGRSVHIFFGSLSNVADFTQEGFIRGVEKDGRVDLYFHPVILNRSVEDDITVDDVLWTCRRLDRLSDRQWRDAFRAAGYSDEETAAYVDHLMRKVREGLALGDRAKA